MLDHHSFLPTTTFFFTVTLHKLLWTSSNYLLNFVHPFSKYLISVYSMQNLILLVRAVTIDQNTKILDYSWYLHSTGGRQIEQVKYRLWKIEFHAKITDILGTLDNSEIFLNFMLWIIWVATTYIWLKMIMSNSTMTFEWALILDSMCFILVSFWALSTINRTTI